MTAMQVAPVTLEGRLVRLEPLALRHSEQLHRHAAPETFQYFAGRPRGYTSDEFLDFTRQRMNTPHSCPFAIVLRAGGEAVGETVYMDIRSQDRGLEIGGTWIAPHCRGTLVNPETKYLLLRHAFAELRALRVQLKCDARNLQSRYAIEKLGAQFEGILRNHMVMPDGHVRDTVMYSITEFEWPGVQARLEERLGYVP